ncbi:MAG TPA: DUF5723 family protein [Chryseolinea sp.]|nr:DUF5723 family protein [Chryseolinea sp.]
MKRTWSLLIFAVLTGVNLYSQHYSAIHGSNYSGSLGVYNNPSSIVNVPYKWDLTLFGAQFQTISNAVTGRNFPSYFSGSDYEAKQGNFIRKADVNVNLRLLNARYSISQKKAIAFGLNFRSNLQLATSPVNYHDSIVSTSSFLEVNQLSQHLNARFAGSAWMEVYGTYAFTLWDQESSRLNAGVTLKFLKGMSGGFVELNNVNINKQQQADETLYTIANGDAKYGYSSNHGDASSFDLSDLFGGSKAGFAVDLGVEYLVKSQELTTVYDDVTYNDYDWKIGVSLLDLGANNFTYGSESRSVASLKEDVSGRVLNEKFHDVKNLSSFNDSLATIVGETNALTGNFSIMNPARAVVNVDRYLTGNFYLNGELSVNLIPESSKKLALRETKLLTITPRWETRRLGVYLPFEYTTRGNFWVGAALKAGPLLVGTHNLLNAFAPNKTLGGGAYIALIIRPWKESSQGRNKQYDCPPY